MAVVQILFLPCTEFARDLEKDVGSEFSGSLKKFLLLLCQVLVLGGTGKGGWV